MTAAFEDSLAQVTIPMADRYWMQTQQTVDGLAGSLIVADFVARLG